MSENDFEGLDPEKLAILLREVGKKLKIDEESRVKTLEEQEAEELSHLPRGMAGIKARSSVNAKYQVLRYGARANGSLEWLKAERAKKELVIPDGLSPFDLMSAYQKAIAPWKGNVRRITAIQTAYRAKGLNI